MDQAALKARMAPLQKAAQAGVEAYAKSPSNHTRTAMFAALVPFATASGEFVKAMTGSDFRDALMQLDEEDRSKIDHGFYGTVTKALTNPNDLTTELMMMVGAILGLPEARLPHAMASMYLFHHTGDKQYLDIRDERTVTTGFGHGKPGTHDFLRAQAALPPVHATRHGRAFIMGLQGGDGKVDGGPTVPTGPSGPTGVPPASVIASGGAPVSSGGGSGDGSAAVMLILILIVGVGLAMR
jgi:hypothetical protein